MVKSRLPTEHLKVCSLFTCFLINFFVNSVSWCWAEWPFFPFYRSPHTDTHRHTSTHNWLLCTKIKMNGLRRSGVNLQVKQGELCGLFLYFIRPLCTLQMVKHENFGNTKSLQRTAKKNLRDFFDASVSAVVPYLFLVFLITSFSSSISANSTSKVLIVHEHKFIYLVTILQLTHFLLLNSSPGFKR